MRGELLVDKYGCLGVGDGLQEHTIPEGNTADAKAALSDAAVCIARPAHVFGNRGRR